jgi:hypothetical protein
VVFVRPPFYALPPAPLAWLPLGGVLVACGPGADGAWVWAFRRWEPMLSFGSMYLPTALGIAHGQDCVLIAAIVLGYTPAATTFLSGAVSAWVDWVHLFLCGR